MGYVVGVAGKGGTGKTTVAALVVRLLKESKAGSILAIDADPSSNLSDALGIEAKETIGSILDDLSTHPEKIPAGIAKGRFIELQIQSAIAEAEGFDLLVMGRPEGPGCYCYVNNVLREALAKLIKAYAYVVIDNEAGFEHISRRTNRQADVLLVVSDATPVGLKAARGIKDLVNELEIKVKNQFLLINRYSRDPAKDKIEAVGLDYLGGIPQDKALEEISFLGNPVWDLEDNAVSISALRKLGEKIWQ